MGFQTDIFEVAPWLANARSVVSLLDENTVEPKSIWKPFLAPSNTSSSLY